MKKNDQILAKQFEILCHLKEGKKDDINFVKPDGKSVALNTENQKKFLARSLQAFMCNFGSQSAEHAKKLQAFTVSSDLPEIVAKVFNVTQQFNNFDTRWAAVFKPITLLKGQLKWEILDTGDTITYDKIPEGGAIKFRKLTGSSQTVKVPKYGAGLEVTWETIEGRELYAYINQAEAQRAKQMELYANVHYGLLAAAATANVANKVAWQGAATDSQTVRDRATLNKGSYVLGDTNKDKGYGDVLMAPGVIYYDPIFEERIAAAEKVSVDGQLAQTGVGAGQALTKRPLIKMPTLNAALSGRCFMILPGQKIQNSIYLASLMLDEQDITTLNFMKTFWTAFGAAVGDVEQVVELLFA